MANTDKWAVDGGKIKIDRNPDGTIGQYNKYVFEEKGGPEHEHHFVDSQQFRYRLGNAPDRDELHAGSRIGTGDSGGR